MSDIREYLEDSELRSYNKTFPSLTVPALGLDADGYLKTLAEAAIEQVKFLNAYAGIPLDVLYENIGQKHKASNLAALSMFRKRTQDEGTTSRGLELVDIPDDAITGTYSNAFLPAKLQGGQSLTLSSGLTALLTALVGTFTGSGALTTALAIVDEWFLSGGVLQQLALSVVDNLIEGVVSLLVQKILGKDNIVIGDGSAALVPYFESLVTALQSANYKEEATALVTALSSDGALVKQIQDCCPKQPLTDIADVVKAAKWKEANEAVTTALENFKFQEFQQIFDFSDDSESELKKFMKELLQTMRDIAYKTETLEIGGIRLALRATIIHE